MRNSFLNVFDTVSFLFLINKCDINLKSLIKLKQTEK